MKVPERDFIRKLREFPMQHVVGLMVFILEHLPGTLTDDERKRVRRMNQFIADRVQFAEDCTPDVNLVVTGEEYAGLYLFARTHEELLKEVTLTREEVFQRFRPWVEYCLSLSFFFLIRPCPPGKSPVRSLKTSITRKFTFKEEGPCVSVPRQTYQECLKDIESGQLDIGD